MSWLQRLTETYDACFGMEQFSAESLALTPIDHVEQQAHIEMVLDANGQFLRAAVVPKESTLIPATERSAGRTSGAVAHPLCDKLRYVAADFGSPNHAQYVDQLRLWTDHASNPYLEALLRYVERANIVADLVQAGVLVRGSDGELESRWTGGLSPLAKLLNRRSQDKAAGPR